MGVARGRVAAVTFDADQTLWDFAGVHRLALQSTLDLMVERGDVGRDGLTVGDLQRFRDDLAAEARRRGVHDLAAIREQSFAAALATVGHADPEAAALVLVDHYMGVRFGSIRMYGDVAAVLSEIRRQVPIGLLTNGNTDPERCGLPGAFDAVLMGPDHGVEKPDPAAFELIASALGVAVDGLAHVGDDADDIDGANAVGAVSVLIERDGPRPDLRARADHVIATLTELPPLLDLT